MKCRICGNPESNSAFEAREMMMGTREVFTYFICGACGSIQIADIPDNLESHYSENYYSFREEGAEEGMVTRAVKYLRNRYAVFGRPRPARLIYDKFPKPDLRSLSYVNPDRDMRILDVGCGAGELLASLQQQGFRRLTGIDPYNPRDVITVGGGTKIYRQSLYDTKGTWDLIMMHHAFEHMDRPAGVLQQVYRLLAPGGYCLIRIPVAGSYAWERFGKHWVQLDPPRHLFLHSPQSIRHLAEQTGFGVEKTVYDSTAFQFWGSLQYEQNIPLRDPRSYEVNPGKSIFTDDEIRHFEERARGLNREGRGDQAAFILRKEG